MAEVAETGLDHLDPRLREALLDLALEVVRDLGGVSAHRDLLLVVGIVGVGSREVAHRRLALDVHIVLVVVHFETGLGGVHHAPDHDRRDLDRIPLEVVHLEAGALEVAHPERDAPLGVERVGVAEARLPAGADVGAEQLQDAPLVRVDHEQPEQRDGDEHRQEEGPHGARHVLTAGGLDEVVDAQDERRQEQGQRPESRHRAPFIFSDHGRHPPGMRPRSVRRDASEVISLRNHPCQGGSEGAGPGTGTARAGLL
jgi:hypothetical protein